MTDREELDKGYKELEGSGLDEPVTPINFPELFKDSKIFKSSENLIREMKIHSKKKKLSRLKIKMKSKRKRKQYYKQLNMLY